MSNGNGTPASVVGKKTLEEPINYKYSSTTKFLCRDGFIACPHEGCGFNYAHPESPEITDEGVIIPFWGECGHFFDLCVDYHEGQTMMRFRLHLTPSGKPICVPDGSEQDDEEDAFLEKTWGEDYPSWEWD